MSAPNFVLDSSTDPSTVTVNDTGILKASQLFAVPAKVDPGQAFSGTFDITNQRTTPEKGKYKVVMDDTTVVKESDVFDIAPGAVTNITADIPAFPDTEKGKAHTFKADVYRQTA